MNTSKLDFSFKATTLRIGHLKNDAMVPLCYDAISVQYSASACKNAWFLLVLSNAPSFIYMKNQRSKKTFRQEDDQHRTAVWWPSQSWACYDSLQDHAQIVWLEESLLEVEHNKKVFVVSHMRLWEKMWKTTEHVKRTGSAPDFSHQLALVQAI